MIESITASTEHDLAAATSTSLFPDLPEPCETEVREAQAKASAQREQGAPRLRQPNRLQVELRASDLESLLAEDHRAR